MVEVLTSSVSEEEVKMKEKLKYCKEKGRNPEVIKTTTDQTHIQYLIDIFEKFEQFRNPKSMGLDGLDGWELYDQLLANPNLQDKHLLRLEKIVSYSGEDGDNYGEPYLRNLLPFYNHINSKKTKVSFLTDMEKLSHMASPYVRMMAIGMRVWKEGVIDSYNNLPQDLKAALVIYLTNNASKIGKTYDEAPERFIPGPMDAPFYISPREYWEYKNPGKDRDTESDTDHAEKGNRELFEKTFEEHKKGLIDSTLKDLDEKIGN